MLRLHKNSNICHPSWGIIALTGIVMLLHDPGMSNMRKMFYYSGLCTVSQSVPCADFNQSTCRERGCVEDGQ